MTAGTKGSFVFQSALQNSVHGQVGQYPNTWFAHESLHAFHAHVFRSSFETMALYHFCIHVQAVECLGTGQQATRCPHACNVLTCVSCVVFAWLFSRGVISMMHSPVCTHLQVYCISCLFADCVIIWDALVTGLSVDVVLAMLAADSARYQPWRWCWQVSLLELFGLHR